MTRPSRLTRFCQACGGVESGLWRELDGVGRVCDRCHAAATTRSRRQTKRERSVQGTGKQDTGNRCEKRRKPGRAPPLVADPEAPAAFLCENGYVYLRRVVPEAMCADLAAPIERHILHLQSQGEPHQVCAVRVWCARAGPNGIPALHKGTHRVRRPSSLDRRRAWLRSNRWSGSPRLSRIRCASFRCLNPPRLSFALPPIYRDHWPEKVACACVRVRAAGCPLPARPLPRPHNMRMWAWQTMQSFILKKVLQGQVGATAASVPKDWENCETMYGRLKQRHQCTPGPRRRARLWPEIEREREGEKTETETGREQPTS